MNTCWELAQVNCPIYCCDQENDDSFGCEIRILQPVFMRVEPNEYSIWLNSAQTRLVSLRSRAQTRAYSVEISRGLTSQVILTELWCFNLIQCMQIVDAQLKYSSLQQLKGCVFLFTVLTLH